LNPMLLESLRSVKGVITTVVHYEGEFTVNPDDCIKSFMKTWGIDPATVKPNEFQTIKRYCTLIFVFVKRNLSDLQ
jgi:hypothetical protein